MSAERGDPGFADLLTDGLAIRDGFVSDARIRGLAHCARKRRERGDFAAARVGAGERRQLRGDIRGDCTCWLAAPLFSEENTLLADLERLRLQLNREATLGLFDCEAHYAWYPPGAGYVRHVDQLHGEDQRQVSFVLYLNDDWTSECGGDFRVYRGDAVRDIAPIAGRLVCFLTAGCEHAVLPTRRDRLSIAGWYRRRGGPW